MKVTLLINFDVDTF